MELEVLVEIGASDQNPRAILVLRQPARRAERAQRERLVVLYLIHGPIVATARYRHREAPVQLKRSTGSHRSAARSS
jgi:hypothetical protein